MTRHATAKPMSVAVLALLAAIAAAAENDPAVRFRATGKADPIRIGNVNCKPAAAEGAGAVGFDLAWDHSWRVQWEEPAERTGGEATLKLENWDAAWVFVKFRRKDADPTAGWSHATLSTRAADHSVPAGAVLEVGLNDGAERGLGAFVYRAAPGHGPNDWKGVCLRWLHAADGVDNPANVDVRVLALNMVYVPQCAFWAGDDGTRLARGRFSAGYSEKPFRVESEQALTLGGVAPETLNNRETVEMEVVDDFRSEFPKELPAGFPKGYAAFYCMRCEITQRQYVDFLNTLPYALQAAHTAAKPEAAAGASALGEYRNGIRIVTPGVPGSIEPVVIDRGSFVAMGKRSKPGTPATLRRRCERWRRLTGTSSAHSSNGWSRSPPIEC